MNKVAYVSPAYVRGPAVANGAELVAWLAVQTRRVRLPVTIDLRAPTRGLVGSLEIELDDTALGISLVDRLRGLGGDRAALWLEGRWSRPQGSRNVLAIVHVGEAITSPAAATHVESEVA